MLRIPLVDLNKQYISIKEDIDRAILRILNTSSFIGGDDIKTFEGRFASLCGAKHCLGVSSGTSALHLALKAHGIGENSEVLVPSHTFIATAEAVSSVGAKPVFCDIDEATYTIDVESIKKKITEKTKAIIPVHLYGLPADMGPILDLASEKGLIVVEDACQAHLAEYNGRSAPFSGTACYSFYPGKNLGAYGDAGAVVTNDDEIAKKVFMMRDHGREPGQKYLSTIEGFGHRLDTLQAAILNVKLGYLEQWTDFRRKNAKKYDELLEGLECTLPFEPKNSKHVYHLYVIRTKLRNSLQKYLRQFGIETGIHYPVPAHLQPAYGNYNVDLGSFPVTEKITTEILSLPMYAELSFEEIEYIARHISDFLKRGEG